jgi:hypothetical protein
MIVDNHGYYRSNNSYARHGSEKRQVLDLILMAVLVLSFVGITLLLLM